MSMYNFLIHTIAYPVTVAPSTYLPDCLLRLLHGHLKEIPVLTCLVSRSEFPLSKDCLKELLNRF